MAEYYVGATLTIAAVHAKDSREGFFVTRNPLLARPCPIGFKDYYANAFFVFLKLAGGSTLTADAKPLHSRAWVLQEIVLSRRTANFGLDQLRWSCLVKRASETQPKGLKIPDDIHPEFQLLSYVRAFLHHPIYDFLALQSEDAELRLLAGENAAVVSNLPTQIP
jgi:hypothetical protein